MPPAIDLAALESTFLYSTAFFGAFLSALWLGLVFWTYRDIKTRSNDRLVLILASLMVLVLGPPGVVVYLVLRPPKTLDEVYQHALEEEALLTEIEDRAACPGCGSRTHTDWQICPSCHTRLRKPCTHCGQMMDLPWQICPYCGTTAPGVRKEELAPEFDEPLD